MNQNTPVLEVEDLSVTYSTNKGPVRAVNNVSFKLFPGEVMGLVGESGSGKSTMAYAIMRLLKGGARVSGGTIKIFGKDIYQMEPETLRQFRWNNMSMVFQSAMNALNPVKTIEWQILDTLMAHRPNMTRSQAKARAIDLFRLVGIDQSRLNAYPHELSGGMRQRVVMAIAIALEPDFVIMDEPTTALDVVVQKSILDQIMELQKTKGFAILFISHDFSLVADIADRMAVMYAGRIVELLNAKTIHDGVPHHPYTDGLLRAIPSLTGDLTALEGIPGHPPDLVNIPAGCPFHPRCPVAVERCLTVAPEARQVGDSIVECHVLDKAGGAVHV